MAEHIFRLKKLCCCLKNMSFSLYIKPLTLATFTIQHRIRTKIVQWPFCATEPNPNDWSNRLQCTFNWTLSFALWHWQHGQRTITASMQDFRVKGSSCFWTQFSCTALTLVFRLSSSNQDENIQEVTRIKKSYYSSTVHVRWQGTTT